MAAQFPKRLLQRVRAWAVCSGECWGQRTQWPWQPWRSLGRTQPGFDKEFSGSEAAAGPFDSPQQGSLDVMLNQSLEGFGQEQAMPTPEREEMASVLLRALFQVAKTDGRIDANEK